MATYRGTNIAAGTDAEVAAQVAAIDSAKYQAPGAPAKIGVAALNQSSPAPATVAVPPPATSADNLSGVISSNADAFQANLDAKAKAAETASTGSLQDYLKSSLGSATQSELTNDAYAGTVDPAEAELKDINQQITAEQVGLNQQLQALDKKAAGYTTAGLNDEKQRLTDASVARQANLSVIQLAKQGKFDSAKAIADRYVQAKFERQQLTNDALKFSYEQNKDLFDKTEQRAFETAQSKREADMNFERQKEMARFEQTIKQNDPLYRANLANVYSEISARDAASNNPYGTLNGKPQTTTQTQVQGFADRTNQSDVIISTIGSKFTGTASLVGQLLPNIAKSSERQQYEQAQRNFINAVLRRESGAVISDEEFANGRAQYFPVPGDQPEVIAQKAANRMTVIDNLYKQSNVPREAIPGQIIEDADGKRYKVGDDGETLTEL